MTKIFTYLGNTEINLKYGSEVKKSDFREMYKCDSNNCPLKDKLLPKGNVLAWTSDLHSCKGDSNCHESVKEIWNHQKETFSPEKFLIERKNHWINSGMSELQADALAKLDLQNNRKDLKIKRWNQSDNTKKVLSDKFSKVRAIQKENNCTLKQAWEIFRKI